MDVKAWREKMERIEQIKNANKRSRLREKGHEKIRRYIRLKLKKKKLRQGPKRRHVHYSNVFLPSSPRYEGPKDHCTYCLRDTLLEKSLATEARAAKKKKKKKK